MQQWLRQLERRFGALAVPHLVTGIVLGQLAVFALSYAQRAQGGAGPNVLEIHEVFLSTDDATKSG